VVKRILWLLVAFPAALLLVTFAVVNRHEVRLVLDPFRPENPVISLSLPFYAYLFAALIVGVVLGGMATWFAQSRWRRSARQHGRAAARWHAEADRLTRERDAAAAAKSSGTTARPRLAASR
jgi:uncharacterized integral membrane protein